MESVGWGWARDTVGTARLCSWCGGRRGQDGCLGTGLPAGSLLGYRSPASSLSFTPGHFSLFSATLSGLFSRFLSHSCYLPAEMPDFRILILHPATCRVRRSGPAVFGGVELTGLGAWNRAGTPEWIPPDLGLRAACLSQPCVPTLIEDAGLQLRVSVVASSGFGSG